MSKYSEPARCGQPTYDDPYKKPSCCQRRITVASLRFPYSVPKKGPVYFPSADFPYPESARSTGTKLYSPYENSAYKDPVTGDVLSREQWERRGRFDVLSTQRARLRSQDDSDMPRRRLIRV